MTRSSWPCHEIVYFTKVNRQGQVIYFSFSEIHDLTNFNRLLSYVPILGTSDFS